MHRSGGGGGSCWRSPSVVLPRHTFYSKHILRIQNVNPRPIRICFFICIEEVSGEPVPRFPLFFGPPSRPLAPLPSKSSASFHKTSPPVASLFPQYGAENHDDSFSARLRLVEWGRDPPSPPPRSAPTAWTATAPRGVTERLHAVVSTPPRDVPTTPLAAQGWTAALVGLALTRGALGFYWERVAVSPTPSRGIARLTEALLAGATALVGVGPYAGFRSARSLAKAWESAWQDMARENEALDQDLYQSLLASRADAWSRDQLEQRMQDAEQVARELYKEMARRDRMVGQDVFGTLLAEELRAREDVARDQITVTDDVGENETEVEKEVRRGGGSLR